MKDWSRCAGRARFCGTRLTQVRFSSCFSSFMRSAALATKQSNQNKSRVAGSRHEENRMSTDLKTVVRQKYGEAALRVKTGGSSCCGASAATACADPITSNLYDSIQAGQIPKE